MKIETNKCYLGDCLEIMKDIPDKSVDMVLCDLPYGTTANKWDSIISFENLWGGYERIIKDNGAIVLFANQPFTTKLIHSNYKLYKYNWVWNKGQGANFITSHYQPLRVTEDICVFGKYACSYNKSNTIMKYNPQFSQGKPYKCVSGKQKQASIIRGGKGGWQEMSGTITESDGKRYPTNILTFIKDKEKLHPTQKPVALLEYLIKTYTNEEETVLDNCAGSMSTAIACINTNRQYIMIEKDENYYNIGCNRISEHLKTK